MLAVALASCCHTYKVSGKVDLFGYEEKQLSLNVITKDGFTTIDSCKVRHGIFEMRGKIDSVQFALLCCDMVPLMPVFVERGSIDITMSPTMLQAGGSRQNNLLYKFLDEKKVIDNRMEDLMQKRREFTDEDFDREVKRLVYEAEDYILGFMKLYYMEPVGLSVFVMMCEGQPDGNMSPLIKHILDEAPENFRNKPYVRDYIVRSGYPTVG